MSEGEIFAAGFKTEPYWWEAAPRETRPIQPLPTAAVDVAIVGSGYSGLSAALELARGGASVAVLEAGAIGQGASSRNAGYVGRTLKHGLGWTVEHLGEARALAIFDEARQAYDFVYELVARERIDCHLRRCGRFMAANNPAHYEAMARDLDLRRRLLGDQSETIERAQQARETGGERFHGGAMIADMGSLHPALYHAGLAARAEAAGAQLFDRTPMLKIQKEGEGWALATPRGLLRARKAILATNGYSGKAAPDLRRRLIPFHGFMVATEPVAPALMERLLPRNRTYHDYNNNLTYWRRSPDGTRILLGAATGNPTRDLKGKARALHRRLGAILPGADALKLSHVWTGQCAASFDLWPHIGGRDGLYHAAGYCFAGLPMGSWFGYKLARRILRANDGATAFDDVDFPTRRYYWGWPWFRPLAVARFNWLDRRGK